MNDQIDRPQPSSEEIEIRSEKDVEMKKLNQKFDELPLGKTMKLPLSMINSIDSQDFKDTETGTFIEVFRSKSGNILIDDGNHRYHDLKEELLKKKYEEFDPDHKKGLTFTDEDLDLDKVFTGVRKVHPENDYLL